MARALPAATARDRLHSMDFSLTAPAVSSSTCFVSTCTAGSARMMNQPISMDSGTAIQRQRLPAMSAPSCSPSGEKPTFTPVRNNTRPT